LKASEDVLDAISATVDMTAALSILEGDAHDAVALLPVRVRRRVVAYLVSVFESDLYTPEIQRAMGAAMLMTALYVARMYEQA